LKLKIKDKLIISKWTLFSLAIIFSLQGCMYKSLSFLMKVIISKKLNLTMKEMTYKNKLEFKLIGWKQEFKN
jgi:hypothetical protein